MMDNFLNLVSDTSGRKALFEGFLLAFRELSMIFSLLVGRHIWQKNPFPRRSSESMVVATPAGTALWVKFMTRCRIIEKETQNRFAVYSFRGIYIKKAAPCLGDNTVITRA
jgi:hypothetical protein